MWGNQHEWVELRHISSVYLKMWMRSATGPKSPRKRLNLLQLKEWLWISTSFHCTSVSTARDRMLDKNEFTCLGPLSLWADYSPCSCPSGLLQGGGSKIRPHFSAFEWQIGLDSHAREETRNSPYCSSFPAAVGPLWPTNSVVHATLLLQQSPAAASSLKIASCCLSVGFINCLDFKSSASYK